MLLGAAIGSAIKNLDFKNFEIHLNGNLGVGKTTGEGCLQNLNWRDVVTSPHTPYVKRMKLMEGYYCTLIFIE